MEILIVDDGSKDATAEIADRYQKKYPTTVSYTHLVFGMVRTSLISLLNKDSIREMVCPAAMATMILSSVTLSLISLMTVS